MGLPYATPITSLNDCYVVGAGWYWGGGVITCRGYVPYFHAIEDTYYQHLIHLNAFIGEHLHQGDVLGKSNGWIEWGLNPHWYGIWGPSPHPGPWINPLYSGYAKSLKLPVLHPMPYVPVQTPVLHRTHMVIEPTPIATPVLHPEQFASDVHTTNVDIDSILVIGALFILCEILFFGFLIHKRSIT